MPLAGDSIFAGYRILRRLGSGGMGEVYLAQHPRLPRQDALKVLRADISADPSYRTRFNREADLAAKLWHPHIVGIHDRGEYDRQLWISMDYVDGTDAARLLHHHYPNGMPLSEVAEIVTAVAGALDYAHTRGLLHRDVKPANILIARLDNGERRILLSDFGVARDLTAASSITMTNMAVGTMAYAAPEQLMGQPLDGRADQYALAATAFHLLTGSPLYPHSSPAITMSQHLAALAPVFATALAQRPADRFPSCMDFARALSNSSQIHTAVHPTWQMPTPAAPSAHRWGWTVVAVAVFLVLCAGVYVGIRTFYKPASTESFSLTGTVHLKADDIRTSGLPAGYQCAGGRGFDDLAPGAPVTVADESDKILGKGAIESSYGQPGVCNLRFTVKDVPTGASFYRGARRASERDDLHRSGSQSGR